MLVFAHIVLIILEIVVAFFAIKGLIRLENKVNKIHITMLEKAKQILEINDEIRKVLSKINKVMRILTNKKLYQIKKIVMMSLDIIQLITLIKTFKLSKGLKSIDYNLLKKLAYARVTQQVLRKILDFAQNLCAI
ncbi:MAG: hypothetical protein E7Z88_01270 [Cyanobacteria bacterium SIG27]|nr:hypothetical protein [Cyanobacteria bacterium SIG27]